MSNYDSKGKAGVVLNNLGYVSDAFQIASSANPYAAVGQYVGRQAVKALARYAVKRLRNANGFRVYKRKEENMDEDNPVVLHNSAGQLTRKRRVKFQRKRGLAAKQHLSNNVVTYIWDSSSPGHAKYGSISIPNCSTGAVTSTAADVVQYLPMHMYDLSSAPNYIRHQAKDGATMFDALVANPTVAYSSYMKSSAKGTLDGNYDRQVSSFTWTTDSLSTFLPDGKQDIQYFSAGPDGSKIGSRPNKWLLKYLKKPIVSLGYAEGAVAGYSSDVVPVGGKIENQPYGPRMVYTPPVGPRPIHLSTKIKMCLVGCGNQDVDFDIAVVRFREDFICPTNGKQYGYLVDGTEGHAADGTTTWTSGAGETPSNYTDNAAVKFWESMALPYVSGIEAKPDWKSIEKYCHVLARRRERIHAKTSVETDASLPHKYISFDLNWNTTRSYSWLRSSDNTNAPPWPQFAPGNGNWHGPGFATDIANTGNIDVVTSPKSRIFLLVRARSAMQYGSPAIGGRGMLQDVKGDSFVPAAVGDYTPTYDITIENTFLPDKIH